MDEITEKRVGKARDRLADAGAQLAGQLPGLAPDMEPLVAELRKHKPAWASELCTFPGLFTAYAMTVLRSLGAPDEYFDAALAALAKHALDLPHTPVYPQADTAPPDWVTAGACEHEPSDIPGGREDQVLQCYQVLVFAFYQFLGIFDDDAMIRVAVAGGDPHAELPLEAKQEAADRAVRTMAFYGETMSPMLAAMIA